MNPYRNKQDEHWLHDNTERYLNGELGPEEQERFEYLLEAEDAESSEREFARAVNSSLRNLPQPDCPASLIHTVDEQIRRAETPYILLLLRSAAAFLRRRPRLALGYGLAAAALVLCFGLLLPGGGAAYTPEEITQARAELEWTLNYVAAVNRQTTEIIRNDVIQTHVVQTLNHSLQAASWDMDKVAMPHSIHTAGEAKPGSSAAIKGRETKL